MEVYIGNPQNGDKAIVTPEGLLRVYSVSESIVENAAENGSSYNVNTGSINLTGNATTSAVLYLKNNGSLDLHVATVGYLLGNSTGGSGDLNLEVVRNPTGGTIVTGATNVDINVNKNAGSSETLKVDAFKGAEGLTLTGGEAWYYSLLAGSARTYAISTGTLVITPGSSIGVNITTQSGNTAMNAQVFLSLIEYTL